MFHESPVGFREGYFLYVSASYICFLTRNKCISTADSACACLWRLRFLCCYLSCPMNLIKKPQTHTHIYRNAIPILINSFLLLSLCLFIQVPILHPFKYPSLHLSPIYPFTNALIHQPLIWHLICVRTMCDKQQRKIKILFFQTAHQEQGGGVQIIGQWCRNISMILNPDPSIPVCRG